MRRGRSGIISGRLPSIFCWLVSGYNPLVLHPSELGMMRMMGDDVAGEGRGGEGRGGEGRNGKGNLNARTAAKRQVEMSHG